MRILAVVVLMSTLSPALALATADPREGDAMEEIEVLASRVRLSELRAEMARTEDAFYARFNELVDDPEMHVTCEQRAPIGTRMARRTCTPQYVATANAEYMRGLIQSLSLAAGLTMGGASLPPASPDGAIVSHDIVFQDKVTGLLKTSPELRELAQRRQSLEILYRAAQRVRFRTPAPKSR